MNRSMSECIQHDHPAEINVATKCKPDDGVPQTK